MIDYTEFHLPIVYLRLCGWSFGLIARALDCNPAFAVRVARLYLHDWNIPTLHEIEREHGGCEDVSAYKFWERRVASGLFDRRQASRL
jgi:hypothetical protein